MTLKTPRRPVELEVERWKIDEKGFTSGPYLGRFELLWPRPGIDSVQRAIPLPDRIGEEVDWRDADLIKKWLFKEDMEGRMILSVSVVPLQSEDSGRSISDDAVDIIGRSVARETSITWRTLSDLINLGGDVANYILSGPQKAIAQGHVVIDEQTAGTHQINLHAPNILKNPEPDPTPEDHRPKDDHDEILKDEEDDNGFISVKMKVWDD